MVQAASGNSWSPGLCIKMTSDNVNKQTITKPQVFPLPMAALITKQLKAEDFFLPVAH